MAKLYIEDTLKESTNLMTRMGLVSEESINKKKQEMEAAIGAIDGEADHVETFCIITGQNPGGEEGDNRMNRAGNKRLRAILKAGHYAAVPVKGKYGNIEASYIILNLPIDNAKEIANEVGQQSFIFGRKEGDGKVVFELYMKNDASDDYDYIESKDYYENQENAEDYYTEVGGKKFSVPFDTFKEGKEKFNAIINERLQKSEKYRENFERLKKNCLKEGKTLRYLYENRQLIYRNIYTEKEG